MARARIARATGTASPPVLRPVEAAMIRAVEECTAEGVTDPDVILRRKLAARAEALAKLGG